MAGAVIGLDASSWDAIVPALERSGHRTHALTLPGMESRDADRDSITLRDHIDAVVREIDSLGPGNGKVVLVGNSGGGAVPHAAVDARADRAARSPGPQASARRSSRASAPARRPTDDKRGGAAPRG